MADSKEFLRTMELVPAYVAQARNYTRPLHENIAKWRSLYDFRHYKGQALPYEERYADPTPTNIVDLATGIILANDIEWKARGWSPDMAELEGSSAIEKFLAGALYVNSEREGYYIPYEVILNAVRDGAAVIYSVWDPVIAKEGSRPAVDPESGEPILIHDELPLRTQAIDPLQITVFPGGPKRWSHVNREWEMSVHDVESTWGVKLSKWKHLMELNRMQQNVKVWDFWQIKKVPGGVEVENALMADGDIIIPLHVMDGYEDIPYSVGYFKPITRTPDGWHSILRPIETTIEHLEQTVNRRARQINLHSSLPLVAKTLPERSITLDAALGKVVELDPSESLEFPSWSGNPPDVETHISFLRSRLQQAGFSDVMFGSGTSQVSGYALSQLGDQSRIRLEQPIKHLEMLWSTWARKVLRLARAFTVPGTVLRMYGQLHGQDFVEQVQMGELEDYMVKAVIKPEYPNERVRNHAMAAQVSSILSETTIMEEYLDIDQPDDERKKRLRDMAINHPLMQQFAITRYLLQAAQSTDEITATAATVALQQMQGPQQQGPPQGMPMQGPPQGMPNALGMPSAEGGETPQAMGGQPPGQSIMDIMQQMTNAAPGMVSGEVE